MLLFSQLYDGDYEAAMRTALRLAEFEDVLDTRDIFSLVSFFIIFIYLFFF